MQRADGIRRKRGDDMPRLPVSDTEMMNRQVRASESYFRSMKELSIPKAAKSLGVCRQTYDNRMSNPGIITLDDFRLWVNSRKISDDEILRMIRKERR